MADPRDTAVPGPLVLTLGHSSRTLAELLALLAAHDVARLVDIRRYPGSRRHPHFSRAQLQPAIEAAGLEYRHAPQLGGHRSARPDSVNTAWEEDAFRGYADHMQSDEFARALTHLLNLARERRTAVMCAEARWEGCHRSLLSDRLRAEGVDVRHVIDVGPPVVHPWTPAARLVDGRLDYRAPTQGRLPGFEGG